MAVKWKSRTWLVLVVLVLVVMSVASMALFLDKATFGEWSGFHQWVLPSMYAIAKGGSTADKWIRIKESK